MNTISYTPIGVIRPPFQAPAGMPIQSVAATGVAETIELTATYQDGLQDLEDFSHLFLGYHFHLVRRSSSLVVAPFLDDQPHGVLLRTPRNARTRSGYRSCGWSVWQAHRCISKMSTSWIAPRSWT
jgi:tRNA (Thr-GGU) A37 N-methylase